MQLKSAALSQVIFFPSTKLCGTLSFPTEWQVQVLLQMADMGAPEDDSSVSSSLGLEVMEILKESAERLNMFSDQLQLRNERDTAHRIAQVYSGLLGTH